MTLSIGPHDQDSREADEQQCDSSNEDTDRFETGHDADEDDLDESDLHDAEDARWDVFIPDDEDPLPEYGDFWFPD